jgi:signal transduction histidine kinase
MLRQTEPIRRAWPMAGSVDALDRLTPREREVADLVAHGYTNRQIAQELVLTEGTVANHVRRILGRLGLESRTQVAALLASRAFGRHEDQLRQEFMLALGREMKNPLTVIKGYAQLAQRHGSYDADGMAAIVHQAARLERLVDDLLDASSAEIGHLRLRRERVDLVALARQMAAHVTALSPRHEVRVSGPESPVVGWWDRGRLEQVIDNLLSNATRYSPNNGRIDVRIWTKVDHVCLQVVDQGVGIPHEALAHVFDRFYRVERAGSPGVDGLGIGLWVSRALVEAHGGRIEVESTVGRGSAFTVSLPVGVAGDGTTTASD